MEIDLNFTYPLNSFTQSEWRAIKIFIQNRVLDLHVILDTFVNGEQDKIKI